MRGILPLFLAVVMLCTIQGITVFAETWESADAGQDHIPKKNILTILRIINE